MVLNWVNPDSVDLAQINVYASKTNKLDTATLIAQAATTTFTHAGLGDNETVLLDSCGKQTWDGRPA